MPWSMWDRVTSQVCKGYRSVPLQTFDLSQPQSVNMLSDDSPQFSQVGALASHQAEGLEFVCGRSKGEPVHSISLNVCRDWEKQLQALMLDCSNFHLNSWNCCIFCCVCTITGQTT